MSQFAIDQVPFGVCYKCNRFQQIITKGGYWQNEEKWICVGCKAKYNIAIFSEFCEWCRYKDINRTIGSNYNCPRCSFLQIGHNYKYIQIPIIEINDKEKNDKNYKKQTKNSINKYLPFCVTLFIIIIIINKFLL